MVLLSIKRAFITNQKIFYFSLDPDPFTYVKKSEGGEEMDMSFLKELEEQDAKK